MAVTKKPSMGKPKEAKRGAATGKLMDNQDRVHRGDSEDNRKVPTTILLPVDLKDRAQEYAKSRGTTLTWLITEGLYSVLDERI